MYVGKKLGARNFIKKEIIESETNLNPNARSQQEILDNNMPTQEQVQNVPVHDHQEEHKQPNIERSEGVKKKQIRCKKWPGCKAENCEFAHPSETVKTII